MALTVGIGPRSRQLNMSGLTMTVSENILVRVAFDAVREPWVPALGESALGHFQYWTPENDDFASQVE